ncbi:MAG: MFS transporter, partial [Propionibacteriaceae bacterium]|nr:MFS transporter [Propionibacteriaceae bacterium]
VGEDEFAGSDGMVGVGERKRRLMLAASLVAIELVSGMQVYLTQTILPIMAADLQAQPYYGVLTGMAQIATFIALPIGAQLVRRYPIRPLLMGFTVGLCAGAVICALAPTLAIYLVGQILRAFAGGCLATISIGAVAVGLQGRTRQVTLALIQGTWIISSILGPVYAAAATALLSWRWAMVLYLPLLVAGRWMVASQLRDHRPKSSRALPVTSALLLGAGLALTIVPAAGAVKIALVVAGSAVLAVGAVRVLPAGTFTLSTPRHRALALLFGLTGTYFAGDAVVALTAHDRLGLGVGQIGAVVMAGGLGWALVGLLCGLRPARGAGGFRRRATAGLTLIALGSAVTGGYLVGRPDLPAQTVLVAAWAMAGAGMGLVYLDVLNRLFEEPARPDGLDLETVAGASIMAESVAVAIAATLATTWIGTGLGLVAAVEARHAAIWIVLAVAPLVCLIPVWRGSSRRRSVMGQGASGRRRLLR